MSPNMTDPLIHPGVHRFSFLRIASSVALVAMLQSSPLAAQEEATAASLIEIDFEELVQMDIQVESAGKTSRRALDLPYAAHVVTADKIRNSGAQSIPDALRLVPGVSVAQISSAEWSIGIRGGSGRFSRFVLVMVNGKIAYNSVFSGVNWDEMNITLSDIERIEVIRGPNAAAWGANAVNGIINIITYSASETQGTQVRAWAGSGNRAGLSLNARLPAIGDWQLGSSAHIAQWQGLKFDTETGTDTEPDHDNWRLAFKGERETEHGKTMVLVDGFQSHLTPTWDSLDVEQLSYSVTRNHEHKRGWSVFATHRHNFAENNYLQIRAGKNKTTRDTDLYMWDSYNTQLDAEWNVRWGRHLFSTGINTRSAKSSAATVEGFPIQFSPTDDTVDSAGIFISDTVDALDNLQLTFSARVDKSDLSQQNIQPSVRALWQVSERSRLWTAYSEATTTPFRVLVDVKDAPYYIVPAAPPELPLPILVRLGGYPYKMDDTRLKAVEAGFRHRFDNFNVDISLFNFDYEDEVDVHPVGEPVLAFSSDYLPSHLVQSAVFVNASSYSSRGGELSMHGQFSTDWSYQLAFSVYDRVDSDADTSYNLSGLTSIKLNSDVTWNIAVRLVDGNISNSAAYSALPDTARGDDSYQVLDTNILWRLNDRWKLSFIANNIGADHAEGVREMFSGEVMSVEPYGVFKVDFSL